MIISIVVITETRITKDMYPRLFTPQKGWKFKIFATEENSSKKGGVLISIRESCKCKLLEPKAVDNNVIHCRLEYGKVTWSVFGVYFPPSVEITPILKKISSLHTSIQRVGWAPLVLLGI